MTLNKEWVAHLFRDAMVPSTASSEVEAITPSGAIIVLNNRALEAWESMIFILVGELYVPDRARSFTVPELTVRNDGKIWGTELEAEQLVVLGKAVNALDFHIPKAGRPIARVTFP